LKFAVESRAFAEALRLEHEAVAALLEDPGDPRRVDALRVAHEAVAHQKLRVTAAHGVRK
jgi:hypothetical protein